MEGSPCIGWGLDSSIVPKTDFYKNIRPHSIDPFIDMGAIESPYDQTVTSIEVIKDYNPDKFILFHNYPNPFNPITNISYQIAEASQVSLSIYNMLGQNVTTLVSKNQPAGTYNVKWDASGFSSGVYLYRLVMNNGYEQTRELVLIK